MTPVKITGPQRALYEHIRDSARDMGIKNPIPTPGFLRSERVLQLQNAITFPVRSDESSDGIPVQPFERRLLQNDSFYLTHNTVMYYQVAEPLANVTTALRARARMHSFPNALAFLAAFVPELIAAYNGQFSLSANETIYIRDMDALSFQFAETAQEGVENIAANIVSQDAWRQNEAFRNVEAPMIWLNGPDNIEAVIKYPDALDFTSLTHTCFAVWYARGWRVQNGGLSRSGR